MVAASVRVGRQERSQIHPRRQIARTADRCPMGRSRSCAASPKARSGHSTGRRVIDGCASSGTVTTTVFAALQTMPRGKVSHPGFAGSPAPPRPKPPLHVPATDGDRGGAPARESGHPRGTGQRTATASSTPVKRWLAARPRFESSALRRTHLGMSRWLNQVEAVVRTHSSQRAHHRERKRLVRSARTWLVRIEIQASHRDELRSDLCHAVRLGRKVAAHCDAYDFRRQHQG